MPQDSPIPTAASPLENSAAPGATDLLTSPLLTTEEAARVLRIDPSSVRRWRAEQPPQGPPFIRLSPRVVLYDTAGVRTWLAQRRIDPGQVAA